jgi:hypothetical protein
MNEDFFRTRLETALRQLDWREGITKAVLIDRLTADPPAQKAMGRSLVDGVYFSPADVLNSLPPGAWAEPPPAPPPARERRVSPMSTRPVSPVAPNVVRALPDPIQRAPAPVLAGAAGTVAVIGFVAALIWLLRRMRES